MARVKVVVTAPYARPCIENYRRRLEAAGCEVVEALATERLEEDQLLEVLPGALLDALCRISLIPAVR